MPQTKGLLHQHQPHPAPSILEIARMPDTIWMMGTAPGEI